MMTGFKFVIFFVLITINSVFTRPPNTENSKHKDISRTPAVELHRDIAKDEMKSSYQDNIKDVGIEKISKELNEKKKEVNDEVKVDIKETSDGARKTIEKNKNKEIKENLEIGSKEVYKSEEKESKLKPSHIKEIDDKISQTQQFPITYKEEAKTEPASGKGTAPAKLKVTPRSLDGFQFSSSPLQNPIFDYLNSENNNVKGSHGKVTFNNVQTPADFEKEEDKIPEGQYIKRKIVHNVSYLVPQGLLQGMQATPEVFPQQIPQFNAFGDTRYNYPSEGQRGVSPVVAQEQAAFENMAKMQFFRNQPPGAYVLPFYPNNQLQPYFRQAPQPYLNGNQLQQAQVGRQIPGLPWPFPLVIKDPIATLLSGSTTYFEFGNPQCVLSNPSNVIDEVDEGSSPQTKAVVNRSFVNNKDSPIVSVSTLPTKNNVILNS